jgi:hypothetical protein
MHGASAIPSEWIEIARRPAGRCLRFTADLDIADVAGDLVRLVKRN